MYFRIAVFIFMSFLAVSCATSNTKSNNGHRTHTVVAGDTLAGIAQKYYGDSDKWQIVYRANQEQINEPMDMKVGMTLDIPPVVNDSESE